MTDEPETLGGISHTNPYTGRVFGETQTYSRGKTVAADGGEADADDGTDPGTDGDSRTLSDVSHAVGDDPDATQRTFGRGRGESE